ncbi:LysM peptidoglycan-binding domain-containing protein [Massilia arenosa]|uniref:LysM peptidoglycan-binding domain-containing protein n=1 Tax=Zemynaea arenosa TaxID=2561931 RepID=A0A4Y9SMK9_9BURK|nr:peptidoglycan DD-metalloendopeptidase family protein [Massilia arenosa]TFW27902.1 LysM peptidoglycan-binding domain-containing protein [Massilia arenosa]
MKRSHFALLTLSLGLTACSSQLRQAPVIERTPMPAAAPAPVVAEPPPKVDAKGTYTVRKGDTLIRIALDHGLNYRDLAAWNNLSDPDDIKADQVLRTEAPAHPVVTTARIDMPPPTKVPPVPEAPRKTGPKADKKPYTDANLAEMQKADAPAKAEPAAAPAVAAAAAIQPGATVTATDDEKLSWMWPADGKIIATFDEGKNKGIDISGKPGQAVLSAGSGKVMYAGAGIRGYGNLVIVKHSNSLLSAYAHNQKIVVKEGDEVKKGQQLAEMGSSDADQVKLHFEIRQQGKPVDPTKFLPSR